MLQKGWVALLILVPFTAFGQQSFQFPLDLQWEDTPITEKISETASKSFLSFEGAVPDGDKDYLPRWFKRFEVYSPGEVKVRLENAVYELVAYPEVVKGIPLPASIQFESGITVERKRPFGYVSFIPLIRDGNQVKQLVRGQLVVEIQSEVSRKSLRRSGGNYAANSVLANGQWYKIGVKQSGIYRIGASFLSDSLGWDLSTIDPRTIKVYGNGGNMLPERNDVPRIDDLAQDPIVVSGEGDGHFDASDYILFYGEGPTKITYEKDSSIGLPYDRFSHEINLYSNKGYYFITHGGPSGKRIQTISSTPGASYTTSEGDVYLFHDNDLENLTESGREWYGEHFDFLTTSNTFSFSLPDRISSEPVYLTTVLCGRALSGSNGFVVKAGSQTVTSVTFATVGSNYYDTFAQRSTKTSSVSGVGNSLEVSIQYSPSGSDPQSQGWLNYIGVQTRRTLSMRGDQMFVRDAHSVASGRITEFRIPSAGQYQVWDVTNPVEPVNVATTFSSGVLSFARPTDTLRTFMIYTGNGYYNPTFEGSVGNQNLHGTLGYPDLVIVTPPAFLSVSNRLADIHRQESGYDVAVVQLPQIYNEFSSGSQDISAIRDMMRMLYERAQTPGQMPQYLLLMGDGSFDHRNLQFQAAANTNWVPTYQSNESLNRASTFVSDDFFGLLDPTEGTSISGGNQGMDIGVGRLPVRSVAEADQVVDKIKSYYSNQSYGNWRDVIAFVADDEDGNTHINQSDGLAKSFATSYPIYNVDKIYIDAFQQISTPSGAKYPQVNQAINARIFSGALVMNYTGHGGEAGWAHEQILTFDDIKSWNNPDRLPLFVTATCSFSRFDNPSQVSGGELVLTRTGGGGIALVTTVRLSYASANETLNRELFDHLFEPINGEMPTLGQVMMATKNKVGGGSNSRKFTLLGDPAMKLAYPKLKVYTTEFQAHPFRHELDTLKALMKVTMRGEVRDAGGQKQTGFNGVVYPTIYDKTQTYTTQKNDPDSKYYDFDMQNNIIYKGKASVNAGEFAYTFVVPKDIAYNIGPGKISYYANTNSIDAHGYDTVSIGGSVDSFAQDNRGPEVKIYMNDKSFVFGGITDESPLMLVELSDENGINTAGSAIGHDITGVMDEEDKNTIVLNNFYEAALDDFTRGEVRYPFNKLSDGRHMVRVKAWDTYNNSGEGYTEFVVAESAQLALDHVLNYPNPFTTNTEFWFEHNRPGEMLDVRIEIFTVSGKLIKTISQEVVTEGYHVDNITWNGLDDYGDPIGKGVYVYKVSVRGSDGANAHAFEKLVVLR